MNDLFRVLKRSIARQSLTQAAVMDPDEILLDAEERMGKAADVYQQQLTGIRTGRASAGLVESVRVDLYGSPTPLKQCATISTPEPQQIAIRPYDASQINAVVKAIQASDLGLAPNSDGRMVRLNVPPLSTERRKQLVSRVNSLAEEAKVSIRNVRRDANKHADALEKELGEDEVKRVKDEVQDLTKKYESQVSDAAKAKEAEVMED